MKRYSRLFLCCWGISQRDISQREFGWNESRLLDYHPPLFEKTDEGGFVLGEAFVGKGCVVHGFE